MLYCISHFMIACIKCYVGLRISLGLHQRPYREIKVSMARKCHNQTADQPMAHGEEESTNTESHNLSKQPALSSSAR